MFQIYFERFSFHPSAITISDQALDAVLIMDLDTNILPGEQTCLCQSGVLFISWPNSPLFCLPNQQSDAIFRLIYARFIETFSHHLAQIKK